MRKSDLKIGYLLECRNGELKMLMPTTGQDILIAKHGGFYGISALKEDLTTDFSEKYDIVKVYGFSSYRSCALDFDKKRKRASMGKRKKGNDCRTNRKRIGIFNKNNKRLDNRGKA